MLMKRLILLISFLMPFAGTLHAKDTNLFIRRYPVQPSFVDVTGGPSANGFISIGDRSSDPSGNEISVKEYFQKCGVHFPDGAYLTYHPFTSSLFHSNTKENHLLFGRILRDENIICSQIQFDALFVDFSNQEIEQLARANSSPFPRSEDILGLWKEGKGEMLHVLKLMTRSGVNAQITGASEQIYATEFGTSSSTNIIERAAGDLPVPGAFKKLEVGPKLNLTPTIGPDGETIDVVLAPEIISRVTQELVTVTRTYADGEENHLSVPQPLFHSQYLTTSIMMKDQSTRVLGGMPNSEGDGLTYLFLTVTLIDRLGQPMTDYMGEAVP